MIYLRGWVSKDTVGLGVFGVLICLGIYRLAYCGLLLTVNRVSTHVPLSRFMLVSSCKQGFLRMYTCKWNVLCIFSGYQAGLHRRIVWLPACLWVLVSD